MAKEKAVKEPEKVKVHIVPLALQEITSHGYTHYARVDPQLQELDDPVLPEGASVEDEKEDTVKLRNMFGQETETELELHLLKIKNVEPLYEVAGMREGPSKEEAEQMGIREIKDLPVEVGGGGGSQAEKKTTDNE
jgi:hypothetical protein